MNVDRATETNLLAKPWVQLAAGVVCMACVANLQYGWTLFVNPIESKYHWKVEAIQVAFTLFVLLETSLNPVAGYLGDRFGPRRVMLAAASLVACAWLLNSMATSLDVLYLGGALGGMGTGFVYGICMGNALKWFPSRRGLAAGLTAAGYGAGAAITVGPIATMIHSSGYEHAFAVFGLIQGGIVAITSSLMLPAPVSLQTARFNPEQTRRDYSPSEVLRNPIFYIMYLVYVMVAFGGLTLAASVAPIAKDMQVDSATLRIAGMSLPAVVLALDLNRLCDGIGRPFFGWVSDRIGRELTMALGAIIGAAALLMLDSYGTYPLSFVLLTALYFGVYGEIFSLFPATAADTFGARFATVNVGMLYTAKGTASLLVPAAVWLARSQGWSTVFILSMCLNLLAALLAVFVLAPLRERHFSQAQRSSGAVFRVAAPDSRRRSREGA